MKRKPQRRSKAKQPVRGRASFADENRLIPISRGPDLVRLLLAALILLGCSPALMSARNSPPTVQPGRGVRQVCEVGMTVQQVGKRSTGVTTRAGFIIVPSVGAVGLIGARKEKERIENITFYATPYVHGVIPGLEIRVPFRGTVDRRLSFEQGGVSRKDVETAFGVISNYAPNLRAIIPFANAARPYWYNDPVGSEVLYYPNKGIHFNIVSNEVTSFTVFEKLFPALPVWATNRPKVKINFTSDPERLNRADQRLTIDR
ncbi:MAG: hypothetical protein FJ395_07445 [Verrucomicrobia bacterium]|nr:hypothetical protein [Verrucomicrobiota bacterium]